MFSRNSFSDFCLDKYCKTCLDFASGSNVSQPVGEQPLNAANPVKSASSPIQELPDIDYESISSCELSISISDEREGGEGGGAAEGAEGGGPEMTLKCEKVFGCVLNEKEDEPHSCLSSLVSRVEKSETIIKALEENNIETEAFIQQLVQRMDAHQINERHNEAKQENKRLKKVRNRLQTERAKLLKHPHNSSSSGLSSADCPPQGRSKLVEELKQQVRVKRRSLQQNPVQKETQPKVKPKAALSLSEHQKLINQLKNEKMIESDQVYQAMLSVDFKIHFQKKPYSMKIRSLEAKLLEDVSVHVKPGGQILYIIDDCLYIPTCLSLMVGVKGQVVSFTRSNKKAKQGTRSHSYLLDSNRLIVLIEPFRDKWSKGYVGEIPFDLILVEDEKEAEAVRNKLKPEGVIFVANKGVNKFLRKSNNSLTEIREQLDPN